MKKSILLFSLFIIVGSLVGHSQSLKTFILIRHAEKANDDPRNPNLSADGEQRAQNLLKLLKLAEIEAIYSTDYKRTVNTVMPLANHHDIEVQKYQPFDKGFLGLLVENTSGTVVISGHSNTIPTMVNELIGEDRFEQLDEQTYNLIYVVTLSQLGDGLVTILNY